MRWRHFGDIDSANAYCDAQTVLMHLPVGQVTTRWADPTPLADGTFVVAAYQDDTAVDWDASWILASIDS